MPLLETAQSVEIIDANQPAMWGRTRRSWLPFDTDEILSRLADQGADLLVMGAYGHSRMCELVFGGVTRHIARHMTAPTLWSH
jgi:hypothetical protein